MKILRVLVGLLALSFVTVAASELRIGLIGLDTSHVVAFARLLNDPSNPHHLPGGRIVGAFRGGSPDVEASWTRLDGFTRELEENHGVQLYATLGELCRNVDAVMLTSVDGRTHLAQAIPVLEAGLPLYIDKPMAASLRDVIAIFQLAETRRVPLFSSSSLRFGRQTQAVRNGSIGRVWRAETTGPCAVEPTHPELFWYGIHGVESLFAVMGTGCQEVQRGQTQDGRIEVTGRWRGGRTGTFREASGYGGMAWGTTGEQAVGANDGYAPLLAEVLQFFQTGVVPVPAEETIELFAFMEASDESRRRDGAVVTIDEILRRNGYLPRPQPRLTEVRRIWSQAPHNAFTDLERVGQEWICVFREGAGHVSPDGRIRVLMSPDGDVWKAVAQLQLPGADLRDPKLSRTPKGELLLTAVAAYPASEPVRHQTHAWYSADGLAWSDAVAIGEPNIWLWRVSWHEGTAYGVGYSTVGERFVRLYRSDDGRRFEALVPRLLENGYPNETSLGFESGDTMVALLRRDGDQDTARVGWARPPYTDWVWRDLGVRIGGPQWLRVPGHSWLAAARLYEPAARTVLGWVDVGTSRFKEWLELPSGGDTSYAGMQWHEDQLWISYYSSHEARTSIYLARVEVESSNDSWSRVAPGFETPAQWAGNYGGYRSPLRFTDGTEVATTEDWARRREEILDQWHGLMGEWPPLLERPGMEVLQSETHPGFVQHRVRFEIAADRFEEGWMLVPHGRGPFGAVVVPFYDPESSVGLSGREGRDLARQLTQRGLVTLAIGSPGGDARRPDSGRVNWQPLSFLAYVAANAHTALAQRPEVDAHRIGIAGHSYGGKWALFAAALHRPFACVAVSDPGVVWDETRPNVNYWEPWYLGQDPDHVRRPGIVTALEPRTGAYSRLQEEGRDLHELHALLAPRPLWVAGGAEDPPERWQALNHLVAVNATLGFAERVGYSHRAGHDPTPESNRQIADFFDVFLAP
jgi:dienelactone hydrolase